VDVLSDVLATLKVRGSLAADLDLGAPWAFGLPKLSAISFHVVTKGSCYLTIDGSTTYMEEGDLVLMPRGDAHVLSDTPKRPLSDLQALTGQRPPVPGDRPCRVLSGGGTGARASILCGTFVCGGAQSDRWLFKHPCWPCCPR